MPKYQWNYQEIKENRNTLQQMYHEELDITEKENIKEIIEMYDNMLSLMFKTSNNYINDDCCFDDIKNFLDNQLMSYQYSDISIINMLLHSYLPFKNVYTPTDYPTDIPIIATNDELITIVNDFIHKMIPNNIQENFIESLNKYNNIHLTYNIKNRDYGGITLLDSFLNKKYIYVARDNHLMDIIKLPHELFHYVFCDCDVFTPCNYSTYYLSEIEGSFANILFGDYYYKQATINPNFFNLNFLKLYNDHIEAIVTNNALLDSVSNNKIRMNKLNKYLNYFGLPTFQNPTEIVDYLSTPLEILIKYAFGYLIAIDLYTMYQNDPEFSFYLLKNLKFIKRENDIVHLLRNNHITFMDDDYENLKKYTKKIERQN